jgi:eukaryotic-like serine/threonine-protein kinase
VRLGGSMRRHRPSGREGGTATAVRGSPRRRRSDGAHPRVLLLALAVAVLGSGGGYLYATHVVFPGSGRDIVDLGEVPDLRGMMLEEADPLLRDRGLGLGAVDSINHPTAPPGQVLGQSPLPGQLAAPLSEVELTLSLGPERRPIPDVSRLRADRALTVLQTTGFTVVVDSLETDVPAGRVASVFPEPGAVLPLPAQVWLTVSLGPPLLPMPHLTGLQEEDVRVMLDSLGLVIGELEERFRFGFNQGEVLEQFPPADSLIPAGTSVRLVIGRRGLF